MCRLLVVVLVGLAIVVLGTDLALAIPADPNVPLVAGDTVTAETHSNLNSAEQDAGNNDRKPPSAQADSSSNSSTTQDHGKSDSSTPTTPTAEEIAIAQARQAEQKLRAAVADYRAALQRQATCLQTNRPLVEGGDAAEFCPPPARPDLDTPERVAVGGLDANSESRTPIPTITPEQAAYLAVAQLKLPTIAPGIGPSPELNEWGMAVVGYPYWLWADGATSVGPVSQSVANLSVSLRARVVKVAYQMGDGSTVICNGAGTRWTKAAQPGAKSPTCGYVYTKPSLPADNYRIVATSYWSVDWQINGASGVISVPRTSSLDLPVGELEVLVR